MCQIKANPLSTLCQFYHLLPLSTKTIKWSIIWYGKDWRKPSSPSRPCRAGYQFEPMGQWAKAFSSSKGTKGKPSLFPAGHLWREMCPQQLLVTIMGLWLGRRMPETRCSPRSWEVEHLNHLPGPRPRHLVKLLVPGLFNKMTQYIS